LEEEEEQRVVSLWSGAELRAVDLEEVVSGVTIEYSLATDQEEGPEEPDPAADRVFIITKKGEHYLHVTPAGTSEADVARQLLVAQDKVKLAVDATRRTVEQACAHAEEATTQLQTAASVEQARDSVKQAASESAASAAALALPDAKSRSGDRSILKPAG
jgi:hypothetical protein